MARENLLRFREFVAVSFEGKDKFLQLLNNLDRDVEARKIIGVERGIGQTM